MVQEFEELEATKAACSLALACRSPDGTSYVQTMPANQLELGLWLEAERMGFLKIDQTTPNGKSWRKNTGSV